MIPEIFNAFVNYILQFHCLTLLVVDRNTIDLYIEITPSKIDKLSY